jgi:STAS-like domain of unknown function (DUF4325)
MTIYATDITQDFWTGAGGRKIGDYIANYVIENSYAEYALQISFLGIDNVTPSFVNGSFLYLIDVFGEQFLKQRIKVVQANSLVAQTIRNAVQSYFEYQKTFFSQLKTNSIYCAIDGSEQGKSFRFELFEAIKKQGFNFYYNPNDDYFLQIAKDYISKSDVFIGIITHSLYQDAIFEQVNFAILQCTKPCLLLCKYTSQINIPTSLRDQVHVVYYGQGSYYEKLREINQIVQDSKHDNPTMKPTNTNQQALAWTLLGLGAVALITLLAQEETIQK